MVQFHGILLLSQSITYGCSNPRTGSMWIPVRRMDDNSDEDTTPQQTYVVSTRILEKYKKDGIAPENHYIRCNIMETLDSNVICSWSADERLVPCQLIHTFGPVNDTSALERYALSLCGSRGNAQHLPQATQLHNTMVLHAKRMYENQHMTSFWTSQSNVTSMHNHGAFVTIDPSGTTEYDDAISLSIDESTNICSFGIMIASPLLCSILLGQPEWLNRAHGYDTLYGCNRTYTMFPEDIITRCTLSSEHTTCGIIFSAQCEIDGIHELQRHYAEHWLTHLPWSISYVSDCLVSKHYTYKKFTKKEKKTIELAASIDTRWQDAHDLVADMMVCANAVTAKRCCGAGQPIIMRSSVAIPDTATEPHRKNDDIFGGPFDSTMTYCGMYTMDIAQSHEALSISQYCHMSSPLRRWVDNWNQLCLLSYDTRYKNENSLVSSIIECDNDIMRLNQVIGQSKLFHRMMDTHGMKQMIQKNMNMESSVQVISITRQSSSSCYCIRCRDLTRNTSFVYHTHPGERWFVSTSHNEEKECDTHGLTDDVIHNLVQQWNTEPNSRVMNVRYIADKSSLSGFAMVLEGDTPPAPLRA